MDDNDTRDTEHVELTWTIDGAIWETEYFQHAESALEWVEDIKRISSPCGEETKGAPGRMDGDVDGLWQIFATHHGAHAIGAECDCIQFETSCAPLWSNT